MFPRSHDFVGTHTQTPSTKTSQSLSIHPSSASSYGVIIARLCHFCMQVVVCIPVGGNGNKGTDKQKLSLFGYITCIGSNKG